MAARFRGGSRCDQAAAGGRDRRARAASSSLSIWIARLSAQLRSTAHWIRSAPALGASSRGGRIRRRRTLWALMTFAGW